MTDPKLTRIAFLLDRSGSMQSIKTDIEGGFDAFIADQLRNPGECTVTLAQFDNVYDVVYTRTPLRDVPPLDLQPRGSTALLDAIGRLVTDMGAEFAALPESQRPGTVIVAIMTDGMENSSREWTHAAVKALIEQQTKQYDWQFLYMGADQDAIEVGSSIGIDRERAVTYGRGKSKEAMRATSANISAYRHAKAANPGAVLGGYTAAQRKSAVDD